jgi:hypothetical protein
LPPLPEGEPTCVIIVEVPLDAPFCSIEPASIPGDDAVPLQAGSAKQAKPRTMVRHGPRTHGKRFVIRSPRVISVQWRLDQEWLSFRGRSMPRLEIGDAIALGVTCTNSG